ncbi:MAG TPA: hypothetical protein VKB80_30275 [Kofleriaceae bacterium]|nr:hypothetical protein [Kofleriaceae bacterium]
MTREPMRDLEAARARLTIEWSDSRTSALMVRGRSRLRRRRRALGLALAVTAIALFAALGGRLAAGPGGVAIDRPHTRPQPQRMQPPLPMPASRQAPAGTPRAPAVTGFSVVAESRDADVRVRRSGRDAGAPASVDLVAGAARFEAVTASPRRLELRAGSVAITVQAWVFSASRAGDAIELAAVRGPVQVWVEGEEIVLVEGARRRFAPRQAPPARPRPRPSPAELASVDRLLTEVDAARAAGDPERAVMLLERVATEYARAPEAGLAAFTRGRILLEELGRPRLAASAFARAAELDSRGRLAEDALAREVEAWHRAGDAAQARDRARAYLQRYPDGYRTERVRQLAGLP